RALVALVVAVVASPALAMPKAYVGTTGSGGNAVAVIDVSTNGVLGTIPVAAPPFAIATNPRRPRAYVSIPAGSSGTVHVIDTASDAIVDSSTGTFYQDLVVDPDGTKVFGIPAYAFSIDVLDPETGAFVSRHDYAADGIDGSTRGAIDPTGRRLVV